MAADMPEVATVLAADMATEEAPEVAAEGAAEVAAVLAAGMATEEAPKGAAEGTAQVAAALASKALPTVLAAEAARARETVLRALTRCQQCHRQLKRVPPSRIFRQSQHP